MSKSITEQVRAAVAAGGGQTAVAGAIQATGGNTTQPQLSTLCSGRTPSLATLREISKACGGWVFTIDQDTDIGSSRPPNPSEKK
jgi:hypothetical protein